MRSRNVFLGFVLIFLVGSVASANDYLIDNLYQDNLILKDSDTLGITTNGTIEFGSGENQTLAVFSTSKGDIENNGTIITTSSYGSYDGTAIAIAEQNASNTIKNSGNIQVSSSTGASTIGMANLYNLSIDKLYYGYFAYIPAVNSDTKGDIENNGVIDINSTTNAIGIIQINGQVVNRGKITVYSTGVGDMKNSYLPATVSGISQIGGDVINYGDITTVSYGIMGNNAIEISQGNVENYGSIDIRSYDNNSTNRSTISGVYSDGNDYDVDYDINTTFLNKGSISVSSMSQSINSVDIEDYQNINFTNEGNITAYSSLDAGQMIAVSISSDESQNFQNSGDISSISDAGSLTIGADLTNRNGDLYFSNSGTIQADSKTVAEALLINNENGNFNSINSGLISAKAQYFYSMAVALDSKNCETNIINLGTIEATTSNTRDRSTAFYINTRDSNLTFYNKGKILSYNAEGTSVGIRMYSSNSNSSIINDGIIQADEAFSTRGEVSIKNSGDIETKYIYAPDAYLENDALLHLKNSSEDLFTNVDVFKQTGSGILKIDTDLTDNNGTVSAAYPSIIAKTGVVMEDGSTIDVNLISDSTATTKSFLDNNGIIKAVLVSDKDLNVTTKNLNIVDNCPVLDFVAYKDSNETSNFLNLEAVKVDKLKAEDTPLSALSAITAGFQIIGNIGNTIENRQYSARGLNSGDSAFKDKEVWFKPFGAYTKQDDKDGVNGFDANTYGFVIGSDGEYKTGKRAGIAFSYSTTNLNTNNISQSDDIDTYSISIYGSNPIIDDKTVLFYQSAFGLQKNSSNRYVAANSKTANANYTSKSFFAQASLQREYDVSDKFIIIPTFKGTFRHIQTPAYSETGADAYNLSVDSSSANSFVVTAKSSFIYTINSKTHFTSAFSLDYDLNNKAQNLAVFFQGFPGIVYHPQGIKNNALEAGLSLGLSTKVEKNLLFDINYKFSARGDALINHYESLKLRWKF